MNRVAVISLIGAICCTLSAPVVLCAHRANEAQWLLDASRGRLVTAQQQVDRIEMLRGQAQRVQLRARPTEDVLALVNVVLAESGTPGQHLRSFSNEGESAITSNQQPSASALRQQSMRLSLQGITLPQLGRFLQEWRRQQQAWTPTRIELIHSASREAIDRYDVTLVIASVYAAETQLP